MIHLRFLLKFNAKPYPVRGLIGFGANLLLAQADPNRFVFLDSPDVNIASIAYLVDEGALTPQVPVTPGDVQLVRSSLGLPPAP